MHVLAVGNSNIYVGDLLYPVRLCCLLQALRRSVFFVLDPLAVRLRVRSYMHATQSLAGPPSILGCSYVWTARGFTVTWECTSRSFAA